MQAPAQLSRNAPLFCGYLRRSLERLLAWQETLFSEEMDASEPLAEEAERVARIMTEQDAADYWFAASRDGNREGHYRGGGSLSSLSLSRSSGLEAGQGSHCRTDCTGITGGNILSIMFAATQSARPLACVHAIVDRRAQGPPLACLMSSTIAHA